MKKIRVAQILGAANAGGVESMIMNLYRNIDRTKVEFDFYVENTCPIINQNEIEQMGGKVIIIPKYTHIFSYLKTLKKLLKKGNYDIVHSNMNALSVFPLWAAKKAGIKIRIAHSHSTSNHKEFGKSIIKNILRPFSKVNATHYFACSKLSAEWLFGKKMVKKNKVTIINNAVDLNRFCYDENKRNSIRNELNINDKFVVGHIGRFMKQKNHKFLIDIFDQINKINSNAILLLIGTGPLLNQIKQYVKQKQLENKVMFVGNTNEPEKYYQAMDTFLLPSLYEGLPVVGIEAQDNGLNCFFSTNITNELKVNENVYFLSLNDKSCNWAQEIINKKPINRLIGYQNMVQSHYNIKLESKKLLDIYEHLVKEEGK